MSLTEQAHARVHFPQPTLVGHGVVQQLHAGQLSVTSGVCADGEMRVAQVFANGLTYRRHAAQFFDAFAVDAQSPERPGGAVAAVVCRDMGLRVFVDAAGVEGCRYRRMRLHDEARFGRDEFAPRQRTEQSFRQVRVGNALPERRFRLVRSGQMRYSIAGGHDCSPLITGLWRLVLWAGMGLGNLFPPY
jgi:hypothetical protein